MFGLKPKIVDNAQLGQEQVGPEVLDPSWIVQLLRSGFVLAVLTLLGDLAQSYYIDPRRGRVVLPYDLAAMLVSVAAVAFTLKISFARYWKSVTLIFCLLIVGIATPASVILGEQSRIFVTMMVLLTATCALVPWEIEWQAALTAGFLIVAIANSALVRPISADLGVLWMATSSIAALALASNRLWARWRLALIETCRRLERTEAKLRKVFEASPDSICINSLRDGRYIDINPRFDLSGYSREEVMRRPTGKLDMWAEPGQFLEFIQALVERRTVHNMEADFKMKDGTVQPCLISGAIVELDGEPCAVTFSSDISKLKRTEKALIAAREAALASSRAKSEFLSSMSHEIRTPMNAVLGMADLLGETSLTPEQRRFVDTMTTNGNALLHLINSILDLAKVESGRLSLEMADFDLNGIAEKVVDGLGVRAHEKKLELCVRIMPDVPTSLIGDSLRLQQVLTNLISNAIKFTEQGEVVLTVENEPGAEAGVLRFAVADSGIGIAPDKIDEVFQSFTQADSSTTRKYGGSGLGLAIARRLVELMGGKISAHSEIGRGSTFSFTANFGVRAAADRQPPPGDPVKLEGARVLVVDDNATNRLIVREILSRRGAAIGEAESGEDALSQWQLAKEAGKPYGLILLDCRMPVMDGFEVARRLRQFSGGAEPIMLMLTSDDLNPKLGQLSEAGLDAYVVKPVKPAELLQKIAALIARREVATRKPRTAQNRSPEIADQRPLRILLAEDSGDNRMLIQAYLKKTLYQLEMAENGEIAVEKFMRGRYDLVLMDMQMPVMDGYTATRAIRLFEREQNRPATPIAALTASALEDDVRNTKEAGCTAHLSKPVKKSLLLEVIRDLAAPPFDGNGAARNGHLPANGAGSKAGEA